MATSRDVSVSESADDLDSPPLGELGVEGTASAAASDTSPAAGEGCIAGTRVSAAYSPRPRADRPEQRSRVQQDESTTEPKARRTSEIK
jgi:hypothetical protein